MARSAGRRGVAAPRHLSTISSFSRYLMRHSRGLAERNPAEWVERPRVDAASRRAGLNKAEAVALRAGSVDQSLRTAALEAWSIGGFQPSRGLG